MQLHLFETEPETPRSIGPARVTEINSTNLLTVGKGRTEDFDYTLNPYRGCSFGCSYCYAANFVADEALREDWGKWVEVKVRAVEMLMRRDLRGKRIYMSSATDPYQPIEREVKLTRRIVDVLAGQAARLVVQTRSPLVARDADLFKRFARLRVNMSITTDDDAIRQRFEPGCASIERRLEAVESLKKQGITVAVCVCPMLPMRDPASFGERLREMGVDAVTAGYFHQPAARQFAAATREGALEIAQQIGWTREAYERCREILLRAAGGKDPSRVFLPI